ARLEPRGIDLDGDLAVRLVQVQAPPGPAGVGQRPGAEEPVEQVVELGPEEAQRMLGPTGQCARPVPTLLPGHQTEHTPHLLSNSLGLSEPGRVARAGRLLRFPTTSRGFSPPSPRSASAARPRPWGAERSTPRPSGTPRSRSSPPAR